MSALYQMISNHRPSPVLAAARGSLVLATVSFFPVYANNFVYNAGVFSQNRGIQVSRNMGTSESRNKRVAQISCNKEADGHKSYNTLFGDDVISFAPAAGRPNRRPMKPRSSLH